MQPVTPTTTTTTVRTAEAFRKPHPIRGVLWGLVMGIGAAALAIILKIIPFELTWALIVLGGGILLGILWSTLGPAKKPKGDPPWRPAEQVTTRGDWDAGPVPPSPPLPPDVEPLVIQPLDVEPLDIGAVESDVPRETVPEAFPDPVVPDPVVPDPVVPDPVVPDPVVPDPVVPDPDPVLEPPRTMNPPPPSAPPPPPPPPPPPQA
jgi:hypothetical protein